jgi:hypothetical protein
MRPNLRAAQSGHRLPRRGGLILWCLILQWRHCQQQSIMSPSACGNSIFSLFFIDLHTTHLGSNNEPTCIFGAFADVGQSDSHAYSIYWTALFGHHPKTTLWFDPTKEKYLEKGKWFSWQTLASENFSKTWAWRVPRTFWKLLCREMVRPICKGCCFTCMLFSCLSRASHVKVTLVPLYKRHGLCPEKIIEYLKSPKYHSAPKCVAFCLSIQQSGDSLWNFLIRRPAFNVPQRSSKPAILDQKKARAQCKICKMLSSNFQKYGFLQWFFAVRNSEKGWTGLHAKASQTWLNSKSHALQFHKNPAGIHTRLHNRLRYSDVSLGAASLGSYFASVALKCSPFEAATPWFRASYQVRKSECLAVSSFRCFRIWEKARPNKSLLDDYDAWICLALISWGAKRLSQEVLWPRAVKLQRGRGLAALLEDERHCWQVGPVTLCGGKAVPIR